MSDDNDDTDTDTDTDTDPGVPESDPKHIDPAGDIADLIESGDHEIQLSDNQDREELREFIQSVENSDEPTDPGTNAAVRIARFLLNDQDDS